MSKPAKVVILTDLHLRADYFPGFLDAQVETLLHLANRKPCSHVVINGDVFEQFNERAGYLIVWEIVCFTGCKFSHVCVWSIHALNPAE